MSQDPRWSAETYEIVARALAQQFAAGRFDSGMFVAFQASDGQRSVRSASVDEATEVVLAALADAGPLRTPATPDANLTSPCHCPECRDGHA